MESTAVRLGYLGIQERPLLRFLSKPINYVLITKEQAGIHPRE